MNKSIKNDQKDESESEERDCDNTPVNTPIMTDTGEVVDIDNCWQSD